jgi:hypothetical protein
MSSYLLLCACDVSFHLHGLYPMVETFILRRWKQCRMLQSHFTSQYSNASSVNVDVAHSGYVIASVLMHRHHPVVGCLSPTKNLTVTASYIVRRPIARPPTPTCTCTLTAVSPSVPNDRHSRMLVESAHQRNCKIKQRPGGPIPIEEGINPAVSSAPLRREEEVPDPHPDEVT